MAKHVFLTTILVFFIVADVSDAALLWHIRKLVAPSPKEDSNVSPVPSPVNDKSLSSPVGDEKKGKEKQNQPNPAVIAGKDKPKVNQNTNSMAPAPGTDTKRDSKTPKEDVKEKGKSKPGLPHGSKESCRGFDLKCHDTNSMTACVKNVNRVSKALTLLIQNEGDSSIKVDLTIPPSMNKKQLIDIPKLQTEVVNIRLPSDVSNEIRLNAGNGDCVLRLGAPVVQRNVFQHLPSYSKFMTPVYGAYSLFAIVLIAGGVWACCWLGKRKARSEIPYQELEMSMPETAAVAETGQGWDQDWDDDWDEEKAVTSPAAKNISANGLSSRTPNKDGWEDWDD